MDKVLDPSLVDDATDLVRSMTYWSMVTFDSSSSGSSNIVAGVPHRAGYLREAAFVTRLIVGLVLKN